MGIGFGRQALKGVELAPGTLVALTNFDRQQNPESSASSFSWSIIDLRWSSFCLRRDCVRIRGFHGEERRQVLNVEHFRVLLPMAIVAFSEVATALARGDVPDEIMDAIRLGKLTALRKPNGGVRGIVVGDIVRTLVGRTMAQQLSKRVEVVTSPFQYALSTRAGTVRHSYAPKSDRSG